MAVRFSKTRQWNQMFPAEDEIMHTGRQARSTYSLER